MPDEKKHTYQSTTLGLPPLRMVLVHARNDAQNGRRRGAPSAVKAEPAEETPVDKEKVIRKIIEHLQEIDH
jgi:hypothetical protein